MTNKEARQEFERRTKAFERKMAAAGSPVKCTDAERTMEEQARLYAQGRTKPGKRVTNAKPGQSPHNYGLAKDYCFTLPHGKVTWNGPWDLFGKLAKQSLLTWGGFWLKFKDRPHLEFPHWQKFKV